MREMRKKSVIVAAALGLFGCSAGTENWLDDLKNPFIGQ